ncbi:nucleoporin NUP35 isoform X2 [Takifugu flavidus]|uniref:nucleoporin NUP35 isoform X2 n=1 Tax=Takifugu flavidus TaxID=433684 RepID=UPI002544B44B|nr:nucleoporin NUP35 isoform X2 [Takifugu flavidus]
MSAFHNWTCCICWILNKLDNFTENELTFSGMEPMTLGSPTSPKLAPGAQFLPGFLMGDLPAPSTPQPRVFNLSTSIVDSPGTVGGGGKSSTTQLVVTVPKDKSGAPPVRSIHGDLFNVATPPNTHRQCFPAVQTPLSPHVASMPGTGVHQTCLSPAQVDPFYSQGESLSSDDRLDQSWVTVFGFPPASASYILLQFAQYGNILKHTMASPGNWMHLQYQSKLQARKALSKDGKVFGETIMVGVKPCIDKSVMDSSATMASPLSSSSAVQHFTSRSTIRPLSANYKSSSSDYQVVADRQTPRKDDSLVSKAIEYMFGW